MKVRLSRHASLPGAMLAVLVAAALVAGCGGGASPVAPASSAPAPTTGGVPSQADAVARVLAQDARFADIGPLDPNLIGQSAWYVVSPAAVGWRVTITMGWGDCQAGCISRHTWTYEVDGAGTVTLVDEGGDPLPGSSGSVSADGSGGGDLPSPPVAIPADGGPWIAGTAVAGPVCPVVRDPPDPACADRPVSGAMVIVRDESDAEVARTTTAGDGTFLVAVPCAGTYTVEGQPAEGILGAPGAAAVEVGNGPSAWASVQLAYDTGIR